MSAENQASEGPQDEMKPVPSVIKGKSLSSSMEPTPRKQVDEPRTRKRVSAEPKQAGETVGAFASDIHKYIREYIHNADQKAAFLFAAVAAMLAYLHGKGITKLWLKDPRQWALGEAIACLAVVGLVVGAVGAILVVVPRLKGAARGLVFWKSIALFESAKDYASSVSKLEAAELTSARLEHCYELACVCRRKFRGVAVALWCGGVGLAASTIYLALF